MDGGSPIAHLLPLSVHATSTAAYRAFPHATALGGLPMARKHAKGYVSVMLVSTPHGVLN